MAIFDTKGQKERTEFNQGIVDSEARSNREAPTVRAVPAAGKVDRWGNWLSFSLICYITSLCSFTLGVYLITTAEVFNGLVQYNTVAVVQAVIHGVANVAFAKVADVFGRPVVMSESILFFTIGAIVLSSANFISTLSAGMVFYSIGNTGINFALNLLLADLIPANWRCTANNLTLLPVVLNFGVGPRITASLVPVCKVRGLKDGGHCSPRKNPGGPT